MDHILSLSIPNIQATRSTMPTASDNLTLPRGEPFTADECKGLAALDPRSSLGSAGAVLVGNNGDAPSAVDADGLGEPVSRKTRKNRRRRLRRKYNRACAREKEMEELGAEELEVLREKYPALCDTNIVPKSPSPQVAVEPEQDAAHEDNIDWAFPSGIPSGPKPRWEFVTGDLLVNSDVETS
ncbi:hypothetical protein EDC01DRAFT_376468 [Geopyxis carbonaria]|nr:hypothetical protein EDC01DRAFT_376468 [Geopyxis carbonaria]